MKTKSILTAFTFVLLCVALVACSTSGPGSVGGPTGTARKITFSGPITSKINNGDALPGTEIKYLGKTNDDRANFVINNLAAPKKTGDSLNWSGAPAPFSLVNLQARVLLYDDNSATLVGTVEVTIQDPKATPGDPSSNFVSEFTLPANYTLSRGQTIPGSTLSYVGKKPEGAQFGGIDGYPYRQQLDSVVWNGHLRDKIHLKLDLRVVSYSDTSANLVGTTTLRFEK